MLQKVNERSFLAVARSLSLQSLWACRSSLECPQYSLWLSTSIPGKRCAKIITNTLACVESTQCPVDDDELLGECKTILALNTVCACIRKRRSANENSYASSCSRGTKGLPGKCRVFPPIDFSPQASIPSAIAFKRWF